MNPTRISTIILILFYALLTYTSQYHVFFGDMVQFGSRHSHYFFENNFSSLWLPNSLDSGHPPIFGMYIALCWKIFGKSLVVSHWAMFPFLVLIAFAIPKLITKFISYANLIFICLIFFFEPTLSAQASLTSPDIVLVSFFLWALVFYKDEKYIWLSLMLIPMAFVSLRGMMVLFAFFIAIIIHQKKINIKTIFIFAPAVAICFYWLFRHYQLFGWIGFHSDSPWASSFQTVGIKQIFYNLFLMIWRWVDFGRIAFWGIAFVLFTYQFRTNKKLSEEQRFPIILLISLCLVFTANTIFADGLIGHRYYMPIYLIGLLVTLQLIEFNLNKRKTGIQVVIFIAFMFGAKFVYPSKTAMGWDATLAHRPYYKLRDEAIVFLKEKNIPLNKVGTGFPNLDSREFLELNGDTSSFQSYASKDLKYILWSNVFNYPDALQDSLSKKKVIYAKENGDIYMRIIEL